MRHGGDAPELVVEGGTVVTMDDRYRVLPEGAVAVAAGRIVSVGTSEELAARFGAALAAAERIDARGMIVLPGLVDAHGHGGHALLKHIASDTPSLWGQVVTRTYFHHTDPAFWHADGRLAALERLTAGVTTGLCVIGSEPRSDDPALASAHAEGYASVGVREVLAVGPCNPPWPRPASRRGADGAWRREDVTLEAALAGAEAVIRAWHGGAGGRVRVMLTPFVIVPSLDTSGPTPFDRATGLTENDRLTSRRVREVARAHGVRIHADAFGGMVRLAASDPHGLLGPDVLLQHCTGLSAEEVRIIAETGTAVGHAPMSGSLVRARCPVVELCAAGATVAVVTDGAAPRTGFDLLPLPRIAQRLEQLRLGDMSVLPAGRLIAMVTIEAARALGLDAEIGSIEPGKRADLALLDARRPHLAPPLMPVHRLVHAATGADVDTVIVEGRVLMRGRRVLSADTEAILAEAAREAEAVISRAGLAPFMREPEGFWSGTHGRISDDRALRLPPGA